MKVTDQGIDVRGHSEEDRGGSVVNGCEGVLRSGLDERELASLEPPDLGVHRDVEKACEDYEGFVTSVVHVEGSLRERVRL